MPLPNIGKLITSNPDSMHYANTDASIRLPNGHLLVSDATNPYNPYTDYTPAKRYREIERQKDGSYRQVKSYKFEDLDPETRYNLDKLYIANPTALDNSIYDSRKYRD